MDKRYIFPIVLGLVGVAILISLGNWQVRRLDWKQAMLDQIETRLSAPPADLPEHPEPKRDKYLSVKVTGQMGTREIHVLSSHPDTGAGYRVIVPFTLENGRRILVDRGMVPENLKNAERPLENGTLIGNLLWADDTDKYTPDNDRAHNIWFTRNPVPLAAALDTEPVLLVLRETAVQGAPLPVAVGLNIPNNHFEYAVTWYLFAAVWMGMTLYLLWRIKQRTV